MRKHTLFQTSAGAPNASVSIPAAAQYVMARLREAGFEAYLVGGCVRDGLMGRAPNDWDICTSAHPDAMQRLFAADRTVTAGLKHGTLGIVYAGELIEATCYRAESAYSDRRHPDTVRFVADLREDLARRDFTINAMAWSADAGLVDPFGGAADIDRRLIRCVGCAVKRFDEDALRMLRALRFAARFGFDVEAETAAAIHRQHQTLRAISAERVWAELKGLVSGSYAAPVLREFADVLAFVLPGAQPLADNAPPGLSIRLAMLLRECGAAALDGLRCERALRREVEELLAADAPADDIALWRLALRYGEHTARQIACMHGWARADAEKSLARSPCLSLRQLAVDGNDLRPLSCSGAAIGQKLTALAEDVLRGVCPNDRAALLARAKRPE